jgi:hypothetical protein
LLVSEGGGDLCSGLQEELGRGDLSFAYRESNMNDSSVLSEK